jgi:hypothetical protein
LLACALELFNFPADLGHRAERQRCSSPRSHRRPVPTASSRLVAGRGIEDNLTHVTSSSGITRPSLGHRILMPGD